MEARQFHNLIVIGTIETLSDDGLSATVRIGDVVTDMRPLPATYGQNFTAARPIHEKAQVVLNCPSGNFENAVIIGFLWSNGIQPYTTNRNIDGVRFTDGTQVEYDTDVKVLRVKTVGTLAVEAAKSIKIAAANDITISASGILKLSAESIEIDGPVTQTGGDMTSDGISAQEHTHAETGSITEAPS